MADLTLPNPMMPPTPPVQPAKAGSPLRSPLVAGVVGLLVGAVVAGVPLMLASSSSGPFGKDTATLTAPASIGTFTPMTKNPKVDAATVKRVADSSAMSAKNLSAAYGGAAAVTQAYSDPDLENDATLEAVRAQSPIPYVPYEDAHALGMEKPEQEIVTFGQVHCLVANIPVPVGGQEQPNGASAVTCERTSAHLTVRLRFGGGGDLVHSPQQAAALVDTAWGELS